jgi:metal-responsive CopG/Arc/MetJ family transcriptional regulator
MQAIQVVIDEELLGEADRAAKKEGLNRSALLREALRAYLRRLDLRDRERRDREGYERRPDTDPELTGWEKMAAWPEG